MFRVFQNDKSANSKSYPSIGLGLGWDNSDFKTKREAEVYAFHWAYPISKSGAIEFAPTMELNVKYNYSQCEMHIEEVEPMKPTLAKTGQVVELDGRLFKAFRNVVIDQIEPEILVSDYETVRSEPKNQRVNTIEVMEVTGLLTVNGRNKAEVDILSKYNETQETTGKTIAGFYFNPYDSSVCVVFTDNTYYARTLINEYDESYPASLILTTDMLKSMGLLSKYELESLNEIDKAIKAFDKKVYIEKQLAVAKALIAKHEEQR
jgi:hypothetical protein